MPDFKSILKLNQNNLVDCLVPNSSQRFKQEGNGEHQEQVFFDRPWPGRGWRSRVGRVLVPRPTLAPDLGCNLD